MQHQLFSKRGKYNFGTTQVKYLGHIIAQGSISMDPSKVEGVLSWPTPTSIKELKGFLRLSGYYRRFIQHYRTIARVLTTLLKKDTP